MAGGAGSRRTQPDPRTIAGGDDLRPFLAATPVGGRDHRVSLSSGETLGGTWSWLWSEFRRTWAESEASRMPAAAAFRRWKTLPLEEALLAQSEELGR